MFTLAATRTTGPGVQMLELALIVIAYLVVVNFVLPRLGIEPG